MRICLSISRSDACKLTEDQINCSIKAISKTGKQSERNLPPDLRSHSMAEQGVGSLLCVLSAGQDLASFKAKMVSWRGGAMDRTRNYVQFELFHISDQFSIAS